jgi:hypothetical protein
VGSASVVRGEHVWQGAGSRQVQLLMATGGGKRGPIIFDGIVADVFSAVVAVVVTFFVGRRDVLWPSLPFCASSTSSFINIIQLIVTFAGAIISSIVIVVITPITMDASISSLLTAAVVALLSMAIVTSDVAVAPASSSPTSFHFISCLCSLEANRKIGPNQSTAALPMMHRWSGCPWMGQTGGHSCVNMVLQYS